MASKLLDAAFAYLELALAKLRQAEVAYTARNAGDMLAHLLTARAALTEAINVLEPQGARS